jgi:hypothetical protein
MVFWGYKVVQAGNKYEGESQMEVKDVRGFIYVSLGCSTDLLHDSLSSRHTCTCSKAGFSSQNGDRA